MIGFYLIFLAATFGAAVVSGLAGFAFAPILAAVLLHIIPPAESAAVITGFGLIAQGVAVWKFRHALNWRLLAPFLIGAAIGIPLGVAILSFANVQHVKIGIGVFLALFAAYGLLRPSFGPVRAGGQWLDGAVGFANGVLGGVTGIPGILVVMWATLRAWPKDVQRAVIQPFAVASFAMIALWLGGTGAITAQTIKLFLIGVPALLAGIWLGLRLYGTLDEDKFRRVVLVLLLVAGLLLVVPKW